MNLETLRAQMSLSTNTGPPPEAVGDNEYLKSVLTVGQLHTSDYVGWPPGDSSMWLSMREARFWMTKHYAWAIPNDWALDALAALSPIVEVGAGGGYWAYLLRQRKAKIIPYDPYPYPLLNRYVDWSWVPVSRGNSSAALAHGRERHTLLLIWPSYDDPWSENALTLHRGETVAYIGEGAWGCTGTERFHEMLQTYYTLDQEIAIPQWYGLHDRLEIWKR